jgi:DNA-binding NarL/FixJ family response regulator
MPPLEPVRILLVDDFEPFHRFVRSMLQDRPALRVIGEVSDGLSAVEKAQELQPDLILLDVGLPGLNWIEAARRIREISPASKILFVSQNCSLDIVEEALSTGGAGGYVLKSEVASELLAAVRTVLEGKRFISASLSPHVLFTSDTISEFLASIIVATAADFGNVQLFDSADRVLRIVAQHGFEREFLDYFDTVSYEHNSVCSTAMKERSRIVVTDVATDPLFSNESKGVLLRAKVRSVQSTPLIDPSGRFVGMVSTHYACPGGLTPAVLKQIDNLAASLIAKIKVVEQ